MGLSCSANVPSNKILDFILMLELNPMDLVEPCYFDGNIIKCSNMKTKEISIYNIDEQHKIPYIKNIYKKNNKLLVIIINIIQFILFIIFFYSLYKIWKLLL